MKKQDTIDFAESLIQNNCMECEDFRTDIRGSPCICECVMDMIYGISEIPEDEDKICAAWESIRKKIMAEDVCGGRECGASCDIGGCSHG
jgi:hypothetical protein